jgi:hypothetical protein
LLLRDFLIEPVQRVPRYKLLLGELIKHTESGEKLVQLKEAHAQVGRVAQDINSKLNSFEQANKVRGFKRNCASPLHISTAYLYISVATSFILISHITRDSQKYAMNVWLFQTIHVVAMYINNLVMLFFLKQL